MKPKLIIELVKYSLKAHSTAYDNWLRKMADGINYYYAKSTSLYNGLAGIGLGNAYLYQYFTRSDIYFEVSKSQNT